MPYMERRNPCRGRILKVGGNSEIYNGGALESMVVCYHNSMLARLSLSQSLDGRSMNLPDNAIDERPQYLI